MSDKNSPAIRYLNVHIDPENIRQMDGRRSSLKVAKSSIREIKLIKDSPAKRPWVLVIVGIALIIIGLPPILAMINFAINGGAIFKGALYLSVISPIGLLIFIEAFKKKFILEIQLINSSERIIFDGKINIETLKEFIKIAKKDFGFNIRTDISDLQL